MDVLINHIESFNWSALITFIIGIVLGAVVSVMYSIRSQRPKLLIVTGSSGSYGTSAYWRVGIRNQPSFLGCRLNGEAANDVHALIREDKPNSQFYPLRWVDEKHYQTTIEPGIVKYLELFHWEKGDLAYYAKDQNGEPIAKYLSPEHRFLLRLNDRLGRQTERRFKVDFDATLLRPNPKLSIVYPKTVEQRWGAIRSGFSEIISAFKSR